MEKEILKVYTYVDGVNDVLFFDAENPIIITAYSFTANRMGGVTLSATFMYEKMLDDYWNGKQYVEFRGEKHFVKQVPTSSKDNEDCRYKYEVDFRSERSILDDVYFFDVVTDDTEQDRYQSNSSKVLFYGDIKEFAKRLNYSLAYSNLDYKVVIDEGITSVARQVAFENKFISEALQEIYNTYNIPFYFSGKVIHIGYTDNAIAIPFGYGFDRELLSITKTNANYKIVNRCTGYGSSENIPYYYPNLSDERGEDWITPSQYLMPPIYRETLGAERFYNALNDTYPKPDGGFYQFENLYEGNNPKEQIVEFADIKPTIVGVTNANGERIDMIAEFAYDSDDNDDTDAEGNYLHPYFYAKLRRFDGENGFNLFEHAITANTPMTISMTSGNCSACQFEIGVIEKTVDGKEVFENPVQVDENGDIVAGSYADKVKPDNIQPQQQNTQTNEVWIALKKDINTFGTIMPSVNNNYKPSAGDTFVLLYIELPLAYITAAEKRLEEAIILYMLDNNSTKFNFSIKFSKIFFAENPSVLAQINENARLIIEYNSKQYILYISSFSYQVTDDSPLPEISVELTDTLSIRKGFVDTVVDSVKNDLINSGIGGSGSGDIVADGNKYFLRKDIDDNARGNITFERYIGSRAFREGQDGIGWRIDNAGTASVNYLSSRDNVLVGKRAGSWQFVSGFPNGLGWDIAPYKRVNAAGVEEQKYRLEIDDINVRGKLRAYEFVISQLRGENDNVIFAGMMKVEYYDKESGRIYLDTDKGVLYNPFRTGDILMVQRYGGMPSAGNNYNVIKQYELRVVEAGAGSISDGENRLDWITFSNFVGELSDIGQGDVLTRVDSVADSTRKGIVKVTTIDEIGAPYIDVVYGMKTDPTNSTKARVGNLSGIRTKSGIDLTGVWGIYGNGAYFENSTYILDTGNTIEQQFSIMNGKFESEISGIRNDMSLVAGNILRNSSFSQNTNYWITTVDVHFLSVEGSFVYSNYFFAEKARITDIYQDGSRNVLRIRNGVILQKNEVMNKQEGLEEGELRTYSFSLYVKPITSGTLSVGIEGTELYLSQALEPSETYEKIAVEAKWNEQGDFKISYDGEILVYGVSLFDDALADAYIKLMTRIEQTEEYIKLLATKEYVDSENESVITRFESELQVTAEQISGISTKVNNINNTIETSGWITRAEGTTIFAKKEMEKGSAIVNAINVGTGGIKISANRVDLVGQVTFNMLNSSLQTTINGKVNSSDLGDLALLDKIEKAQLGTTIISGGYIKAELLNVTHIEAVSGHIAGFKIKNTQIEAGDLILSSSLISFDGGTTKARIGKNAFSGSTGTSCPAYFSNTVSSGGYYGNGSALVLGVGNSSYTDTPQRWIQCTQEKGWGGYFAVEARYLGDANSMNRTCVSALRLLTRPQVERLSSSNRKFYNVVWEETTGFFCYEW